MTAPTPPRHPLITLLQGLLLVGGCVLVLLFARLASGPIVALMRRVRSDDPVALSAYWLSAGVVLIGAPLAGWWADQAGRRGSLVVGAAILSAALTLLTFLQGQAWVVLYTIAAFGVVLMGVAATTSVALVVRHAALATAIAFCLPYARLTPAVPPGMMGLLQMGERSFAVLGIGFAIAAVLPLVAVGVSYALARRPDATEAEEAATHAADVTPAAAMLDPNPALVLIVVTGWLSQIGPVATDLVRNLRQDALQQSAMPIIGIIVAGIMAYVWAIVADVTRPRAGSRRPGIPPSRLLLVAFGLFVGGVTTVLAARGTSVFSVGMFIATAGVAGVVPIAVTGQLRAIADTRWAQTIGLSLAAFVFGQMAGARLNLYLAAWLGVPATLAANAAAAALAAAWLWSRRAPSGPAGIPAA